MPLSFAQERMWFLSKCSIPACPPYNRPVLALLGGQLDARALESSLTEMVPSPRKSARRYSRDVDGRPVQRILGPAAGDAAPGGLQQPVGG